MVHGATFSMLCSLTWTDLSTRACSFSFTTCINPILTFTGRFSSLGEFFQRPLKPGVRPIDTSCALSSPADCKVLTVGCTQDDVALQVKGLPYSLSALLGTAFAPSPGCSTHYCVLYLAPGDYHRFHSPAYVKVRLTFEFLAATLTYSNHSC